MFHPAPSTWEAYLRFRDFALISHPSWLPQIVALVQLMLFALWIIPIG